MSQNRCCPLGVYWEIRLMRKRCAARMPLLGVLAIFGVSIPAYTATINAASCSQADVGTAVQSAARGDTVSVPAGSCTWATSVILTKGITLAGAGVGNTVITSSAASTFIYGMPDATAIANSENITVTGFTFDGANSTCNMMRLNGASGIAGTKPYRYYIIGNNRFQNGCTSGEGTILAASANGNGQLRGVIYNNTFDRCNIIIRVFSNNDTQEWANTAFNHFSYGVEDNLYFEGNTIMYSSSFSGDNPGWIESGQGGRIVARYNNWNLANATSPQEIWDIHGFQNWDGTVNSGQTGTMLVEYYANTLSNMGTYRWVHHRGSWGLYFNNILTGSGSNGIQVDQVVTGCPVYISPTPTNYTSQTNNVYIFNNTKNGIENPAVTGPYGDQCDGGQNIGWWTYNAACTASSCSVGIGRGTTAPTGTCTTGVGYWVASTATPTTSTSVVQTASFYKCTATNTWTLYYTPYTYPHPLRASDGSLPAPPTNLIVTAH
jgi:hypothetical protein